jgi:hypothetical protein
VSVARFATVTTTTDHGYFQGQVVRLIVPPEYGMDIYYKQVKILDVPSDSTFTTDLNTTEQAAFVAPADPFQEAQVVPMSGVEFNNTSITGPI